AHRSGPPASHSARGHASVAPRGDHESVDWAEATDWWLRRLAAGRGLSPNTIRGYRTDLADLAAFAEGRGVRSPEAADLELLRDWLWAMTIGGAAKTTLARRAAAARG